jgi:transposase
MESYDFIGIDVSKAKFDVAMNKELNAVFARNKNGFNKFFTWITSKTKKPWVCMEATG